MILSKERINL